MFDVNSLRHNGAIEKYLKIKIFKYYLWPKGRATLFFGPCYQKQTIIY